MMASKRKTTQARSHPKLGTIKREKRSGDRLPIPPRRDPRSVSKSFGRGR